MSGVVGALAGPVISGVFSSLGNNGSSAVNAQVQGSQQANAAYQAAVQKALAANQQNYTTGTNSINNLATLGRSETLPYQSVGYNALDQLSGALGVASPVMGSRMLSTLSGDAAQQGTNFSSLDSSRQKLLSALDVPYDDPAYRAQQGGQLRNEAVPAAISQYASDVNKLIGSGVQSYQGLSSLPAGSFVQGYNLPKTLTAQNLPDIQKNLLSIYNNHPGAVTPFTAGGNTATQNGTNSNSLLSSLALQQMNGISLDNQNSQGNSTGNSTWAGGGLNPEGAIIDQGLYWGNRKIVDSNANSYLDSLQSGLSKYLPDYQSIVNNAAYSTQPTNQALQTFLNTPEYQLAFNSGADANGYNASTDPNASALQRFRTDPGYDFAFNQGIKAQDASAAAKGNLLSGNQQQALTQFGQGIADQQYNTYSNKLQGTYNNYLSGLAGLSGQGSSLSSQGRTADAQQGTNLASLGSTYSGINSNLYTNSGDTAANSILAASNARASGYANQANQTNQILGGIGKGLSGYFSQNNPFG